MTSNTTPPPYVASASSEIVGQGDAWRAFSNDPNFQWIATTPVAWVQLDLGAGALRQLVRYQVVLESFFCNLFPARDPFDWTMQGSLDGLIWDIIDTRTGQTNWKSFVNLTGVSRRTYDCAVVGTPYRMFRMNITANHGDPTYTQVGNLNFGSSPARFY